MNIIFNKTTGELKVTDEYSAWNIFNEEYGIIENGLMHVNSVGNEFGPYLLDCTNIGCSSAKFILMYATDKDGNLDIKFAYNINSSEFSEGNSIAFLNSDHNDGYPTFNSNLSKIYFCSDRENDKYNIFFTDISIDSKPLLNILQDKNIHEVFIDTTLSSNQDDKCPYIYENVMVFTSNRLGGFGGFDLYYSLFENDRWSKPINFGEKINTEFNEYRPIIIGGSDQFSNNMMIFSSDRPEGMGGFDLYYIGIPLNFSFKDFEEAYH